MRGEAGRGVFIGVICIWIVGWLVDMGGLCEFMQRVRGIRGGGWASTSGYGYCRGWEGQKSALRSA